LELIFFIALVVKNEDLIEIFQGAGLWNLGNTCFLNSVLQCLTYTEPLAAYLQSGKHKSSCKQYIYFSVTCHIMSMILLLAMIYIDE